MKGNVIGKQGEPVGNKYIIKGEDGREYTAHVGDLKKNEDLLYAHNTELDDLDKDDPVEFVPEERLHAIHVKKA
jgi:hypothetical protein